MMFNGIYAPANVDDNIVRLIWTTISTGTMYGPLIHRPDQWSWFKIGIGSLANRKKNEQWHGVRMEPFFFQRKRSDLTDVLK